MKINLVGQRGKDKHKIRTQMQGHQIQLRFMIPLFPKLASQTNLGFPSFAKLTSEISFQTHQEGIQCLSKLVSGWLWILRISGWLWLVLFMIESRYLFVGSVWKHRGNEKLDFSKTRKPQVSLAEWEGDIYKLIKKFSLDPLDRIL